MRNRTEEEEEGAQKLHAAITAPPPPGAPSPAIGQQVQAVRKGKPQGLIHDVLLADPCVPKEAWVTRCATWHFGHSEHALLEGVVPTCTRCVAKRFLAARTTCTI